MHVLHFLSTWGGGGKRNTVKWLLYSNHVQGTYYSMAQTTWNPRNLEEHWGTPTLKTTDSWKANKKGEKRKLRRKKKLPPRPCVFVRSVSLMRNSLLMQGPWMWVKRRCLDSSEMRNSPGVDTHTLVSSVDRWWRHEVNIISLKARQVGHMKGL